MSSLIEQAARRLEQLRQAGFDVPAMDTPPAPAPAALATAPVPPSDATRAAVAAASAMAHAPAVPAAPPAALSAAATAALAASIAEARRADPHPGSRRVELDLVAIGAAGIVTPNAPRTRMADQYRVVKRPLIANVMGKSAAAIKHANLIMVTSALAGEGKSFTAINLAMSIAAELDRTVMLVDADVARPSVLRVLGLPPGAGLLELLEGKAQMADVLLRTNVDKLTLLPSGSPHPRATELLASDAMVRPT